MQARSLYFTEPYQLKIMYEPVPTIGKRDVLVRSLYSGVSRGTELLVYRGQLSHAMAADVTIASLKGDFSYPLKYGYSVVGEIIACGEEIEQTVLGKLVFAFQPHATHFVAPFDSLHVLPPGMDPAVATMLPSMETAVGLTMDGRPVVGESVIVFGQGVIGLLLTRLLAQFPLGALMTVDICPERRELSRQFGATESVSAETPSLSNYDLAYEVSGNPQALNQAIEMVGYDGRVIIGSWYGTKTAALQLGNDFHRNHVRVSTSQVSTLSPQWRGRWTKARRLNVAWQMLSTFQKQLKDLITICSFDSAEKGYQQLDTAPESIIQLVLAYHEEANRDLQRETSDIWKLSTL